MIITANIENKEKGISILAQACSMPQFLITRSKLTKNPFKIKID